MNRRLLIPIGAGVVLVLLWYVALYRPESSQLADARKRKNQAAQQAATLRDQLSRLQQSRASQPLKQSQLETLRVAIPDQANLAQFILDANDAASTSGVDFLSITPTPPAGLGQSTAGTTPPAGATGASAVPIKIAMSVSGGYFQVLDFMNRLNTLSRLVVIDGVNMTAQAASLQVSLQERIFTTSAQPVGGGTSGGGATAGTTTTTAPGATTTTTKAGGG
jgi:Tfp pilus assembly protein PilO